ncbi:hypothetical protein niasHT_003274 [Heterodera trifolii]|uniref:Uncharacterized protein n=1 Tax=Heterodera trifolii TaxID=157864 RepID=A0ABD2KJW8_9BILA
MRQNNRRFKTIPKKRHQIGVAHWSAAHQRTGSRAFFVKNHQHHHQHRQIMLLQQQQQIHKKEMECMQQQQIESLQKVKHFGKLYIDALHEHVRLCADHQQKQHQFDQHSFTTTEELSAAFDQMAVNVSDGGAMKFAEEMSTSAASLPGITYGAINFGEAFKKE